MGHPAGVCVCVCGANGTQECRFAQTGCRADRFLWNMGVLGQHGSVEVNQTDLVDGESKHTVVKVFLAWINWRVDLFFF